MMTLLHFFASMVCLKKVFYYNNEHAAGLDYFPYQFMEHNTSKQRSILWYMLGYIMIFAVDNFKRCSIIWSI